jgi:hypothetical protein
MQASQTRQHLFSSKSLTITDGRGASVRMLEAPFAAACRIGASDLWWWFREPLP